MTRLEDRQDPDLITSSKPAPDGARLAPGLCLGRASTPAPLQRWKASDGLTQGDRRPDADPPRSFARA